MSNSIAENIALFLKEYPPFNYLNENELIQVATSIGVVNLDKHKILFQIEPEFLKNHLQTTDFVFDYNYKNLPKEEIEKLFSF